MFNISLRHSNHDSCYQWQLQYIDRKIDSDNLHGDSTSRDSEGPTSDLVIICQTIYVFSPDLKLLTDAFSLRFWGSCSRLSVQRDYLNACAASLLQCSNAEFTWWMECIIFQSVIAIKTFYINIIFLLYNRS